MRMETLISKRNVTVLARPLASALLLGFLFQQAAYAIEFNINAIDTEDRNNIDISQFAEKGYIAPGHYIVQVQVNKNQLPGNWSVQWVKTADKHVSEICLSADVLDKLGLTKEIRQSFTDWHENRCALISNKSAMNASLNKATMLLTLTIPQAWMKYQAKNWVPPEYWDRGVNGAFMDYNLYASYYNPQGGRASQSASSYGTLGINLEAWRLRSDYQLSQTYQDGNKTDHDAQWTQNYLYRPLPSINSKLTAGQFALNSDIFDSFRFTGITLQSDERMLPPDLQGYAPQISGIAKSNARVTVMQNGRVLYQTSVPPGPFNISDIASTLQGQLDVTVEEEDGSQSTFQVGSAVIPFLTRQGQLRYKTSAGKPMLNASNQVMDPLFYSGEFSWGWLSNTSLYGGTILSNDDYQAFTAGVGLNMNMLGALSFDVTRSDAKLNNQSPETGYSYRMNYSRRFETTGSQITFAGYRFSDADYVSMNEFINYKNTDNQNISNEKESYVLTFNQYLRAPDMNAWLSLTRNTYWNQQSTTSYSLSLSKVFDVGRLQGISTSFAVSRTLYNNVNENQYYFSFSMPISIGRNISYSMQRSGNNSMTHAVSYSDSTDKQNTWNISGSGTESNWAKGESALRGNYQHYSPWGRFGLSAALQADRYHSASANWSGSLTATQHGAALHSNSMGNNARMMVDTSAIGGVPFNNGKAVSNTFGIAVVPSLSAYQRALVRADTQNLPDGVDVHSSVLTPTFTEGAIGYASLNASQGYQIIGVIRLADGSYPPLGVSVTDTTTSREVGLVAENGFVYLSGVQDNSRLELKWGDRRCAIATPGGSNLNATAVILPCR